MPIRVRRAEYLLSVVAAFLLSPSNAGAQTSCDGYPLQTHGDGPAGYVCRCTYGPNGKADWWAVEPGKFSSPIQCEAPEGDSIGNIRTPSLSTTTRGSQKSDCLELADVAYTGVLSTESTSLVNSCDSRIAYAYCVDSPNGGGHFSCKGQNFGAGHVAPNDSDGISIVGAGHGFRVLWVECKKPYDPNGYALAIATRFDGNEIHGHCQ